MTEAVNATVQAKDILKDMSFAEIQAIEEACRERLIELRDSGVVALAQQFEQLASSTLGMTAKELMSAARKVNKGKPTRRRRAGAASDSGDND